MILLKDVKLETIGDLRKAVQQAIELEHATLPPYLTANFTLHNTGNDDISEIMGSIVGEEMLHLSIASNLLTAIGGSPVINKPPFIPTYPGPLPGGVETGLQVPIDKFSIDLVKKVFMTIEEPEDPIDIKELAAAEGPLTIGMFYEKIKQQLTTLEKQAKKSIFTGNPRHQMTFEKFFPKKLLFPITDLKTACRGIDIIVDQGEGTRTDPFVNPDDTTIPEPAHYYRFQQIVKKKKLVKKLVNGRYEYSFSGDPVIFNGARVPNMRENPKMNDYPVNSLAYVNSKLFNYSYTSLLNSLHRTFNGEPDQIDSAMGLMFSVRLYALKLLAIPDPVYPGYRAGPSFEYVTDEDLSPAEQQTLLSDTGMVVKLSSSNIAASQRFYTDVLSCTVDERYTFNSNGKFGTNSYVQLNMPGLGINVAIGLYKDIDAPFPGGDPGTVPGTAPTFVVADIAAMRKSLLAKGVKVGEIVLNTSDDGHKDQFAFFQDPDNNTLVIRQNVES